jgi:hypothetical protein
MEEGTNGDASNKNDDFSIDDMIQNNNNSEKMNKLCSICLERLGTYLCLAFSVLFDAFIHLLRQPVSNMLCVAPSCFSPCLPTIICRYSNTGLVVRTVCDHIFQRECLLTWMMMAINSSSVSADHHQNNNHASCPSCRYTPLYNVELHNTLWADHPHHKKMTSNNVVVTTTTAAGGAGEESSPPSALATATTTNNPDHALARQYRMVYWVLLAFLLQLSVMAGLTYSISTSSSTTAAPPPPMNN